ncbi:lysophospholipid acyltransferase family protein [Mycobacterium sp.]|jgi:1-acyl-sn-glycerol-3-phosphate acyltransferase|uniref:lysophospholipid acyltransferase family protein n=1 Tax=Mycobacterium sp. TaxID=1785 RepID=UPI002CDE6588|nr:lysophospholipid acyltransferase family protein [Mycobacterium sp.]HXB89844.1 lysophospholipid acyltransferase family protein [Mycobacterium sp.]
MSSPLARDHAWLPRASCDTSCLQAGGPDASRRLIVALRVTLRVSLALLLAPALLMVSLPLPGRSRARRFYCRLMLWSLGVRITVSGGPIRNLPGVLVVSDHMSWLDIVTIGAVLPTSRWRAAPASFVGRADVAGNLVVRMMTFIIKVIPIDRASLRQLPGVVDAVAARLRAGQTVVAFPEGTTWCGLASGRFYPAMFQAAVDTGRPVQPLRLRYHHRDGRVSTVPAYIGDDTLLRSIGRLLVARRTVARVYVESLQLPGADRRELARRCEAAIRTTAAPHPGHGPRRPVLAS